MAAEKLTLMQKSLWSLEDIKTFCECGNSKASNIMKAAKKISVSRFLPSKAKRDNVLQILGLSFSDEVEKLKAVLEAEKAFKNKENEI